jgi:hypothetical protein
MNPFNAVETSELSGDVLTLYRTICEHLGRPVLEWEFQSVSEWATERELSFHDAAAVVPMWAEYMSGEMSEEDVPRVVYFLDVEMLMWDVVKLSEGRVVRSVWEEAVEWAKDTRPAEAADDMMRDEGEEPTQTMKLWQQWKRGE